MLLASNVGSLTEAEVADQKCMGVLKIFSGHICMEKICSYGASVKSGGAQAPSAPPISPPISELHLVAKP